MMMNIAVVHYHLNRGGVTQVILNQIRSLDVVVQNRSSFRVAIFYGGRRDEWPEKISCHLPNIELSLHEIADLDYDDFGTVSSASLTKQIQIVLDELGFSPDNALLHIHNHNLGKNAALPDAASELARRGYPLLLQIHDFAEDFRPHNYRHLVQSLCPDDGHRLTDLLYPQAVHIHYAVLNRRDFDTLRRAGVCSDRLHPLPNPVSSPGELPTRASARRRLRNRFDVSDGTRYLLYPVRCIRRKNIGEGLLWSALADADATSEVMVGFTLAPLNPAERPSYDRWLELARSSKLPCRFEVGGPEGLGYFENLAAADAILTTSVAEGFGMVFLESWSVGRELFGRDLPEITRDFADAGVQLDALSPQVRIPIQLIDVATFRAEMMQHYAGVCADFQKPLEPTQHVERCLDRFVESDSIDFAQLGVSLQRRVIETVRRSPRTARRILELNPRLSAALAGGGETSAETIRQNATAVQSTYSFETSGHRLIGIFDKVFSSSRSDRLGVLEHGGEVLDSFLDITRLHPIRLEP